MATNVGMDEKGKKALKGEESIRRERETEEGLISSRLYLGTACSSLLHQYSKCCSSQLHLFSLNLSSWLLLAKIIDSIPRRSTFVDCSCSMIDRTHSVCK